MSLYPINFTAQSRPTVWLVLSFYQQLLPWRIQVTKTFSRRWRMILMGRLFILWIHKNHHTPWIICVLYTLAVLAIHAWMKNRPPVQFASYVLPTWNALFAITNLLVFVKEAPARLNVLWNYGWTHCICHFYFHVGPVAFWICIFLFSKFIWLIDTMFIILRKKTLTPFRFFHHISTLVYAWYMFAERQGMTWLTFPNALTTSLSTVYPC